MQLDKKNIDLPYIIQGNDIYFRYSDHEVVDKIFSYCSWTKSSYHIGRIDIILLNLRYLNDKEFYEMSIYSCPLEEVL